MQYFDRHEHMSSTTRRTILEIINELLLVDNLKSPFMYQNMFYGLFDGFDYSDQIHMDPDIFVIEKQNKELYGKILNVVKAIKSYPKSETHNTQI